MADRSRVIDLDGDGQSQPRKPRLPPGVAWQEKRKTGEHTYETRTRTKTNLLRIERVTHVHRVVCGQPVDDVIRVVKHYNAVVHYDKVLAAVKVEIDESYWEKPWDNCDGWDHEVQSFDDFERQINDTAGEHSQWTYEDMRSHYKATRGYYRGTNNCDGPGRIIFTDKDCVDNSGYWRSRGTSKQVARELAAYNLRRAVEQLVAWYEDGWQWYYVGGKFRGHQAGVGGVDDEDYAEKSVRHEIASELCHALEKDGYVIADEPGRYQASREEKLRTLKRRLHEQVPGSQYDKY